MLSQVWHSLDPLAQDISLLCLLLLPTAVAGGIVLRGFALWPLLRALIRHTPGTSAIFTALIALSVAIGTGLTAQERALRAGTAEAARAFDMIVAAPGSEITTMLAAVYLQPTALPLLDGETYARISEHPRVALAAPIAFGDSHDGAPVVGTTAAFVEHLAGGLAEGGMFTDLSHALAGALIPLQIGDRFAPAHGHGTTADAEAHGDFTYAVVGRLPFTGTPWDRAILVPVESVWDVHGLALGHGPDWDGTLGPPFAPAFFPGTPAVLVVPDTLPSAYLLRSQFSDGRTMAFFPGAVLSRLHGLMGDVRRVMSMLAVLTQILVALSALAALLILSRLLARRFAVLRALGAPGRFIFALMWSYAMSLIGAGVLLGLALGIGAAGVISALVTARIDIVIQAHLGWGELHMVGGFLSAMALAALLPATHAMRQPIAEGLRR